VDWTQGGALALQIASGIGLAACAGLRAFLPLFAVGVAGRLDWLTLSERWEWLASGPALVTFGIAVLVELAADKIPVVDHVLDATETLIKPCAGALLMAAVVAEPGPLGLTVIGILAAGTTSGVVHLTKAKLRLASTVATAGTGNPLLSAVEDVGALAGTALSIVAPLLVLLLLVVLLCLAWAFVRRRRGAQSTP
jgi:hypothetical protein